MTPFELATPAKIVFGDGVVARLARLVGGLGATRVLFVTGADADRHAAVRASLEAAGISCTALAVPGEPTTDLAREATALARRSSCDAVVAIGGGSALDAGKAIAALAANDGDPLDYLEVIGRGLPLTRPSLPFVAVPTTAGTGSEVTKNAVLADPAQRVKVSLRSEHMLPRIALVDPELTYGVPPHVTASTGLDAITQVIEPFVSNAANPVVDALCRDAIPRGARSIRRAYADGRDREARRDMALTSVFGGLALANAKLGAVHGFAGPIGGSFTAPHGAICARLLPLVIEANVAALRTRAPGSPALARYDELGFLLTGRDEARAEDAVAWAHETVRALAIPSLSRYGMTSEDVPVIAEKSARASSMKGNPIELETAELRSILSRAL